MTSSRSRLALVASLVSASILAACQSRSLIGEDPGGVDAGPGAGGAPATGGTPATGGSGSGGSAGVLAGPTPCDVFAAAGNRASQPTARCA